MTTLKLSQILSLYPRLDVNNNPYIRLTTNLGIKEYDIYGHINFDYENKEVTFKQ